MVRQKQQMTHNHKEKGALGFMSRTLTKQSCHSYEEGLENKQKTLAPCPTTCVFSFPSPK